MAGLNKVELIGRLGADPEVRRLNSGDSVVNLRIATSETWRDRQSGERKERTEWHTVVIFNENIGKIAEDYLKKGSQCYICGQLTTRSWEDRDGQKKYTTEIVLQKFRGELILLDGKRDGDGESGGGRGRRDDRGEDRGGRDSGGSRGGSSGGGRARDLDDEIPFAPEWR